MQAKINLVKDCETAKQKLDRPARLRTILHIKLLVKDPQFCPGNDLIFSVTKYGMKLYLCQDTQHSSQFFCFSSSFSTGNKTETHYHDSTNTTSSSPKWQWQSDANKKRKLVLITSLWSEVSGSVILTWCNYHLFRHSEPSQQIVKFLDLTEKIVQLR